jgi:acetyl esterase/lipase
VNVELANPISGCYFEDILDSCQLQLPWSSPSLLAAAMASYILKTLVYKTISHPFHELKLDLYYPQSPSGPVPILLRLHGGGLLQGNRGSVPPHLLDGITKYGYALVSVDYRLAPQTPLPSILEDVLDSLNFIRIELSSRIETPTLLDTDRIAVLGSSAGGYLGLLVSVFAQVKPRVVLAIYPITNPWGSFFSQPQPHALGRIEKSLMAPFLDENAPTVSDPDPASERSKMYYYMLQEAILPQLLHMEQGDKRYVVAGAIKEHGQKDLPPIYIVHGSQDRLVGVEQSDEVAETLKDIGVVYEYDIVKGADHLFDRDSSVHMSEMYDFMKRYL